MKWYDFCNKWGVSQSTSTIIRNKLKSKKQPYTFNDCDKYLTKRLNAKLKAQYIMQDKKVEDIVEFFIDYMNAYQFISYIFGFKETITDNAYEKCLLIINKFERIKDEYQPTKNSNS